MDLHLHKADNKVLIIDADGEINGAVAEELIGKLEQLASSGATRIIVDFTFVDYISSAGIACLLRIQHRVRKHGGEVKLCSIKGIVRDILRFMRLDRIMPVYADVAAARAAFGPAVGPI
jgi:anti-anti-sigma factor